MKIIILNQEFKKLWAQEMAKTYIRILLGWKIRKELLKFCNWTKANGYIFDPVKKIYTATLEKNKKYTIKQVEKIYINQREKKVKKCNPN